MYTKYKVLGRSENILRGEGMRCGSAYREGLEMTSTRHKRHAGDGERMLRLDVHKTKGLDGIEDRKKKKTGRTKYTKG
jgi:hypothetical protein